MIFNYSSIIYLSLMRIWLLFLVCQNGLFGQSEVIKIEEAHPQINVNFQDSILRHQDFGEILHYKPHRCKNRYGRYGWVDKYHKVILPFEYEEFPENLTHINQAKKNGKYGAVNEKGKTIIPFKYSSFYHYKKQKLIICGTQDYNKTVFDEKGKIIIPAQKLHGIWFYSDTTLALQDFDKKDIKTYNLQGKFLKKWPYSFIRQLPEGRVLTSQISYHNLKIIETNGLVDTSGKVLLPCEYSRIIWVEGDWARVEVFQPKRTGLLKLSTLTLYPDHFYEMNPPDILGNFTFRDGISWEKSKIGLMDQEFKEIFPAIYQNIKLLDEKGHYILQVGDNYKPPCTGVGNLSGELVMDTIFTAFKPTVKERKLVVDEKNPFHIIYDTLLFLTYEEILTKKKGLWHRKFGRISLPEYDHIEAVTDSSYIYQIGNAAYFVKTDGKVLSGPYYKIWSNRIYNHLLVQANSDGDYILLDINGIKIRDLEGEPKGLITGIYKIGRKSNKRSGYGWLTEYGLFDKDLNPITGFVYEKEPHSFGDLNTKYLIRVLKDEHPHGYGTWIAYMKEGLDESFTLIDENGKTFEVK